VDVEAFVSVHQPQWDRLAHLTRRQRRLSGAEAEELVILYQRVGTHLAALRAAGGAVTGAQAPVWRDISKYFLVSFPAALYASRRWWLTIGLLFYLVAAWTAWRVLAHPEVIDSIGTPDQIKQFVEHDFQSYYSDNPAQDFALRVWINNATLSAAALALGILLVPSVLILWDNAINLGLSAGLMIGHDEGGLFFSLIAPHGLLELTAVFVATAAGLRLGWSWVAPGPRTRMQAVAQTGRATIGMAIGLAAVLLVTGLIEGFVTPFLPAPVRVTIGILAELAFFTYVWTLGRRAYRHGEYGDIDEADREASAPVSA
jgi:uncharacterized membrane protein SpoIIM required for sporulation